MIPFESLPNHHDEEKASPENLGGGGSILKEELKKPTGVNLPFKSDFDINGRPYSPHSPYILPDPNNVAIIGPTIRNNNNELEADILRLRAIGKWWSPANPWNNPTGIRKTGEIGIGPKDTKAQATWIKNQSEFTTYFAGVRADANPGDTPSIKLEVALRHDIRRFLEPGTPSPEKRAFLLHYGIDIPESELSDRKMVQYAMINFSLAHLSLINPEEGETRGLLAGIGIEVRGDSVRVTDQGYCEYLGWSAEVGWGFASGSFHPNLTLSGRGETRTQDATKSLQVSVSATEARASMEQRVRIEGDRYSHETGGSLGISSRYGVYALIEYGITNEKGFSRSIGLGYSTKGGPMIEVGREDLLAGSRNIVRTLSLLGSSTRVYYTPGYHGVDEQGNIYGFQEGIHQFFHRAPEIQAPLDRAQKVIQELSLKKQVLIEKDFAHTLDTPGKIEMFASFLEKHQSLLCEDSPLELIHFTKEKIPGGVVGDMARGQLRISNISGDTDIRAAMSSPIAVGDGQTRVITEKTRALGLRVRSTTTPSDELLRGIDAFISHIEQTGESSRLRGKNIVIRDDSLRLSSEQLAYETVSASGYYQEITLTYSTLTEIGRAYKKSEGKEKIPSRDYELLSEWVDPKTLYQITEFSIVADTDKRLERGGGEGTRSSSYLADNGTLLVGETYWRDITSSLSGKKREELSWWGRLKLQNLLSIVEQAKVKNLDYIQEKSNKVLQSSRDALKHLNQEINGTTLYQSIPLGEKDGTYSFRVEEAGSLKDKGIFTVRLERDRAVVIDMPDGISYRFQNIKDSQAEALFARYTWMQTILFGRVIIDSAVDRKRYIPGVLAEIYARERRDAEKHNKTQQ